MLDQKIRPQRNARFGRCRVPNRCHFGDRRDEQCPEGIVGVKLRASHGALFYGTDIRSWAPLGEHAFSRSKCGDNPSWGLPMPIDLNSRDALITVARTAQKPIAFLVGSPLSGDSSGGVPGVASMLDLALIRH